MEKLSKNSYYTVFSASQFLGAKEIIKSMPVFYNRVYFSSKYANILYSNETDETFENVTLLADIADVRNLRQIIKNNFLYISTWDSLTYTDDKDYGFSFLAANIMFILILFERTDDGYTIYSYDAITGNCFTTKVHGKLEKFMQTIVTEQGEIIRTCDFGIEYMSEENTTYFLAPKKDKSNIAVIEENAGFIKTNSIVLITIVALCIFAIVFAYFLVNP